MSVTAIERLVLFYTPILTMYLFALNVLVFIKCILTFIHEWMCSLMHESSHTCMKIDKNFRGSGRLLYHMSSVLNHLFLFLWKLWKVLLSYSKSMILTFIQHEHVFCRLSLYIPTNSLKNVIFHKNRYIG